MYWCGSWAECIFIFCVTSYRFFERGVQCRNSDVQVREGEIFWINGKRCTTMRCVSKCCGQIPCSEKWQPWPAAKPVQNFFWLARGRIFDFTSNSIFIWEAAYQSTNKELDMLKWGGHALCPLGLRLWSWQIDVNPVKLTQKIRLHIGFNVHAVSVVAVACPNTLINAEQRHLIRWLRT